MRNPMIPKIPMPTSMEYPDILPIGEGIARPFWSVMVPTYNRPDYLQETLESILEQAPDSGQMQIMVVDNHSTVGNIEGLVQRLGQGRIEYHRQPQNLKFSENWNSCVQLARGQWVHIMHDDDLVMPEFYKTYRHYIETYHHQVWFAQAVMINQERVWITVSRVVSTTEDCKVVNPLQIIHQHNTFTLNSMVVARELYEKVGGFYLPLHFGCDHEMCARLFRVSEVGYIAHPYVMTRLHGNRDSNSNWSKPHLINHYLLAFQLTLCTHDTPRNRRMVYNDFGLALRFISRSFSEKNRHYHALRLAGWAFRISPSEESIAHFIYIVRIWLDKALFLPMRHILGKLRRWVLGAKGGQQ